jgi:hypothetical protein
VGIETVQGTKSSNTQLIANDALEYFLLINDNTVADSTQTALKEFAKEIIFYTRIEIRSDSPVSIDIRKNIRDRK